MQETPYEYEYFLSPDVCALCWSLNASMEYTKIIKTELTESHITLFDLIKDCLGITFYETMPKKVCSVCVSKVEIFYNFKSECLEKNRKLQEIIKDSSLENIDTDIKLNIGEYENYYDQQDCHSFEADEQSEEICKLEINDLNVKQKNRKRNKYKLKRSETYCNTCRMELESIEKLWQHNSVSHGIEESGKLFKCFGCDKRYNNARSRLGHEQKFCKALLKGYKCNICNGYLPRRRLYEAHVRDHKHNLPVQLLKNIFKCKQCDTSFSSRNALAQHCEEHNTKKNFVCESCGRVFTRHDYLRKHKMTHTGEKRHECNTCGFRAAQRSTLTQHMRKHSGERPYACDLCPLRLTSSSNLRAHRLRHLGVKKYECGICAKKFGYKVSLEEHMASTHEKSQSHPCSVCGAIFSRARNLKRHLLVNHGDEKQKLEKIGTSENKPQEEENMVDIELKKQEYIIVKETDVTMYVVQ